MRLSRKHTDCLVYLSLVLLAMPQAAHAYLDPGTGSYVIQVVVASVVGVMFAFRSALYTLKVKIASLFGKKAV